MATFGNNQFQQGDVLLFNTVDGGNITVEGGITKMTGRFDTMAYQSLFGGNDDDPGGQDTTLEYWGNKLETEPAKKYRSKTQYILRSLPQTVQNLKLLANAAKSDLKRDFLDTKIASFVSVVISIPRLNWVQIGVTIEAQGDKYNFSFTENWDAEQ